MLNDIERERSRNRDEGRRSNVRKEMKEKRREEQGRKEKGRKEGRKRRTFINLNKMHIRVKTLRHSILELSHKFFLRSESESEIEIEGEIEVEIEM